jgi:hypothetical protein
MTTTHPAHPLTEREGDIYFQGDLEAGKALVARDRFVFEGKHEGGHYVHLCDSDDPDDLAEWGGGPTPEEAWRFAIGAHLGPVDEEYDESRLIALLQVVKP